VREGEGVAGLRERGMKMVTMHVWDEGDRMIQITLAIGFE
jgi:hypothetical protein